MAQSVAITLPTLIAGVDPPVQTEAYDGPLDLLLLLVRREGVDVREIPIAKICDAYLAYLDLLEAIDVDVAGDYLVLAATLCQLKARELLPAPQRPAAEDPEVDPREALVRRLLEYERYREAAEQLGTREWVDRDVFTRPVTEIPIEEQPVDAVVDGMGLLMIFSEVMARLGRQNEVHEVQSDQLSLLEFARFILDHLPEGEERLLAELFLQQPSRRRRIYLLLVILELARLQVLDVRQILHMGAIRLRALAPLREADLAALKEAL